MPEIVVAGDIAAPPEQVWDALVDAESQGQWMPLTRVRATARGGRGVGGGLVAVTGLGPLRIVDTITTRVWEPPHLWVVWHSGRMVHGGGAFEITDVGDGRSRVVWTESLALPLGRLGRLGWPVARPAVRRGLALALRRFGAYVERRARARDDEVRSA